MDLLTEFVKKELTCDKNKPYILQGFSFDEMSFWLKKSKEKVSENVSAKDKNLDKYIACIEIKENRITQALAACNKRIASEYIIPIRYWQKLHGFKNQIWDLSEERPVFCR